MTPRTALVRHGLDQRTTYRFSMISKRLVDCLSDVFPSKFNLSINGWRVLSVIERFGPLAAFEVGRYVSLDPDKVTRTVNSLVKQKLIVRREDENDRRRISLSLSANGREVYDEIDRARLALEFEFLSVLSSTELKAFYAAMDKLDRKANELFAGRGDLATRLQPRRPRRAKISVPSKAEQRTSRPPTIRD